MSSSKVDICNVALAAIGADSIRDFDESNKRSRLCDRFYNSTRDYLLSKFDWSFARKYKVLQQEIMPADEIPYGMLAFTIPEDCRAPRQVRDTSNSNTRQVLSRNSWEVMGSVLFCEISTVGLYYTRQEVNTTKFTDGFSALVSLGMSYRLAPPIAQDLKLATALYTQYKNEQIECWESDANIGNTYKEPDEDPNNDTFVNPDKVYAYPRVIT